MYKAELYGKGRGNLKVKVERAEEAILYLTMALDQGLNFYLEKDEAEVETDAK